MPDYSKGKIYMVCSNDGNNDVVYYGSTCNKLSVRMAGHRSDYNHKYKQCSSYKVFDKYGDEIKIGSREYLNKIRNGFKNDTNGDLETAEAYRAEAQWVSKQMDDYDISELNTDLEVVK